MTDTGSILAGLRKVVDEVAKVRVRLAQIEVDHQELPKVILELRDQIWAAEEANARSIAGLIEVLAGHEVALMQLGADPEPVHAVEAQPEADAERVSAAEPGNDQNAEAETQCVPAITVYRQPHHADPAAPHFEERLQNAKANARANSYQSGRDERFDHDEFDPFDHRP